MKQLTLIEYDAARELHLLLSKHTDEMGYYSLTVNEHKTGYQSVREYVAERKECGILDDEDLQDVDLNSDTLIYLAWFKNTPVGHYSIYANSFVDILKRVRAIIVDVGEAPSMEAFE